MYTYFKYADKVESVYLDAEYFLSINEDMLRVYGPTQKFKQLYELKVRGTPLSRGIGIRVCTHNFDELFLFKIEHYDKTVVYHEEKFIDDAIIVAGEP